MLQLKYLRTHCNNILKTNQKHQCKQNIILQTKLNHFKSSVILCSNKNKYIYRCQVKIVKHTPKIPSKNETRSLSWPLSYTFLLSGTDNKIACVVPTFAAQDTAQEHTNRSRKGTKTCFSGSSPEAPLQDYSATNIFCFQVFTQHS